MPAAAKLTAESPFPITRKWSRSHSGITSGEYTINTNHGLFGSTYYMRHNGVRISGYGTQREAKTAVEMHAAGFEPSVRFFNIVKKGN